jgi:4'-phosphopantetheinyl transferase EntD
VIEQILPDRVVAVETREDLFDTTLFPEEEAIVVRAVERRRREFVTARVCARTALGRLGYSPQPITNGERGEPLWPTGVVGSITHCDGYRACALARAASVVTVGIDAELNAPLPDGVLAEISRPEERPWLDDLERAVPAVHWDRLLFSAKESVYKAWFPLARRWLDFEDAVVWIDPSDGTGRLGEPGRSGAGSIGGVFSARLLVEGPWLSGGRLTGFSGRWLVCDGLVLTAIAMEASAPSTVAIGNRLSSDLGR